MKFLRTIRFDNSDDHVFAQGAPPDEWAISGAFEFVDLPQDQLTGKVKQAFANGFLGMTSFGRSTFATVGEATPADRARLVEQLAKHFADKYGAPDIESAMPVAEAEVAFIEELIADAAINTVFTVRRVRTDIGETREEFRTIKPPSGEPLHARIWTVEHDET